MARITWTIKSAERYMTGYCRVGTRRAEGTRERAKNGHPLVYNYRGGLYGVTYSNIIVQFLIDT